MSMGDSGGKVAEINVTPMIDILLVLLIIFMVIVPVAPKGLDALIPQPAKTAAQPNPERAIVVQAISHPGGTPTFRINDTDVSRNELLPSLTAIYANRAERVMFVKGDDNISFAEIAEIIDTGKAANVDHIGLITAKSQVGASSN